MDEAGFSKGAFAGLKDAISERRSGDRFRSVCRIARVRRAQDMGLWRVRNISNEGMMLAADVDVAPGEVLEVALSETIHVTGRVVWSDKGRCGIAFSARIDAEATLRQLAYEQQAEGYRALRLPVDVEAIVTLRDGARPIDLTDISQHGAGFRYDGPIAAGTGLDIFLPAGELRRHALVRWSRGARGGLWFTEPLDRADLESIVRLRGAS